MAHFSLLMSLDGCETDAKYGNTFTQLSFKNSALPYISTLLGDSSMLCAISFLMTKLHIFSINHVLHILVSEI